jgi:rhamnopyranosyl-N-acetylglucosaminyl-diphospho-decaprenol beta-1,3/1,4-galactofuranosyltransferase
MLSIEGKSFEFPPGGHVGVIASVLSYNSVSTLPSVIDGIESQTHQPDRVIIVDNGSDEPTLDFLRQLPSHYEIHFLPENLGLGAGHNTGWRTAIDDPNCDYVWVLENDSVPPPDCLERLLALASSLEARGTDYGAILPKQVHPDDPRRERTGAPRIVPNMTFNGVLIPAQTLRRVGFIREDFFIDQDDWEYSDRLSEAGLPIFKDPTTTIDHIGKGREPSILRTYYTVRNDIYLRRAIRMEPFAASRALFRGGGAIVRTLLTEDSKLRRIQTRMAAIRDGLKGDLGKKDYSFLASKT